MALNTKLLIPIAAVIVVLGIIAAFVLPGMMGTAPQEEEKVFIVVAYHWGFALYDEDYNPIDQIVVNQGDKVKIYFFNARSFAPEFHTQLEEKELETGIGGLTGEELKAKIDEAISTGQIDHGLQITAFKVFMSTNYKNFSGKAKSISEFFQIEDKEAIEQQAVTFVADKPGTYDFVCYIVCGYGHTFMVYQDALKVVG